MSRSEGKSGSSPAGAARTRESATATTPPARLQKDKQESRGKERRRATKIAASDLSDLPGELLKELRLGPRTSLDAQILDVFQAMGGTATLDDILIGLYRKFSVVQKRRFLQNVLWRMVRKGHLVARRSERGWFSLSSKPSVPKRGRRL